MVIIYAYLRSSGNIVSCIPFRYNIDDENIVESRETILDIDPDMVTYDSIRQQVVNILDKEKRDYVDTEFPSDMPGVVTIE